MICFTCSNIFSIYECDNLIPVCVCVWADCHFVSSEPSYDESHARDGET